jgi:diguanylate cyclase (GGDEF)-like protein
MLYLGVREAMVATVVATVAVPLLTWRVVWYKLLFNASLLMFEMAFAFLIFHSLLGHDLDFGSRFVVALAIALMSVTLIETLFVSVAVSCFEGEFGARLRQEAVTNGPMVVVSSVGATILASFSKQWPALTLLGLVPIAAIWMVLRSNGTNTQRLKDFEALHRLSNSVSRSLHREEIARAVISEVQDILRSDRAVIMQVDHAGGTLNMLAATGEPFTDLPKSLDDSRWRPFVDGGQAVLLEPMVLVSLGISLSVRDNVIVAPVTDGDRVLGLLMAAERSGPQSRYDESDVLRASAIANRLASALRNAELHERIEEEAWVDRLTGLPNRNSFEKTMLEAHAVCDPSTLGVVVLGIDRFREVNETLGHQVGDSILVEMSRRIADDLDDGLTLARVTGDEFGVLATGVDAEQLADIGRRLVITLRKPFAIGDVEVSIEVGAGAAMCQAGVSCADDLIRRADVAMNWAKEHHTTVEVYRGEIDVHTPDRLAMLAELRAALQHKQLDVWFQPKIDLVSSVVVGAEALVRWEHPTRGFVPPMQFVPLAETTGLITELTDAVLAKSVAAVRLLNDVGFRLDVSVNLSTLDLLHEDLVSRVEGHLEAQQVPPDQLTLEITETALLEDGLRALSTAEQLQALGVHLSIDDFGTGFSSLSYLRKLPASEIKVDRSFVLNLLRDERDEVIVRSTIDLGHNLGLKVTAEGVEDKATMERLWELGCDLVQGYHIAKPMPLTNFVAWLTTSGHQVARSGIQGAWKPSASPLEA